MRASRQLFLPPTRSQISLEYYVIFIYSSKSLLKEFARNDAPFGNADIDTGYVVTRKGFKKRVDKLDLSFMNYQDAFKSKSTMEVRTHD